MGVGVFTWARYPCRTPGPAKDLLGVKSSTGYYISTGDTRMHRSTPLLIKGLPPPPKKRRVSGRGRREGPRGGGFFV